MWRIFHGQQWPYYPETGIGVSGDAWVDTGYEHLDRGNPVPGVNTSRKGMVQEGRAVLRFTPTWTGGNWFVQGQTELVGEEDESFSSQPPVAFADDMWIRLGMWKQFDVQVGRFEAWEVYHRGLGLDYYTLEYQGAFNDNSPSPASIYGVTEAMFRPRRLGAGAVHVYPTKWLRFELGARYGYESGSAQLTNTVGARPVGILDFGWLKFKVGVEYLYNEGQGDGAKDHSALVGYGAALQFIFDPWIEFGVNGAREVQHTIAPDGTFSTPSSWAKYSVGAFANARIVENLLVGGGIDYTFLQDQQYDVSLKRDQDYDQWQAFGAVQYWLFKQLFIKGVFGYALADYNPNGMNKTYANKMLSGRLRLEYLF